MNAVNVGLVTFIIQHNRIQGVFLLCKITNLLIYSQIFIGIQIIRFCHLDHCIHNSTGGSSFRTGTEQPVLPADSEWPDCILAKIIGQTAMTVFQISHQGVFPILGIVYRFRQTGSFVWALLIQPIPECLQYRLLLFKTKLFSLLRSVIFCF